MTKLMEENQWVWIVVQDPGSKETFLGQKDKEKDLSFIPVFLSKEDAERGLSFLVLKRTHKYEVQAIHFKELFDLSDKNKFMLFLLNGEGEILEKITP